MSATSSVVTTHRHTAKTNTGLSNGLIGVMCFLTSEMALFGSLIFMYLYVRRAAPHWPPLNCTPHGCYLIPGVEAFEWQLPTVNTVVLLSSGVTMHFAYQALRRGSMRSMYVLLLSTIVLGAFFLGGQAYEYHHLLTGKNALTMSGNAYGATFFTLTGLHGLHVTGGIIFLLVLLFGTIRGQFSRRNTMVPHAATLYWHFVDAVWVVLFALFYLTVP
jgi:cytochrome c oxidase subunit 3